MRNTTPSEPVGQSEVIVLGMLKVRGPSMHPTIRTGDLVSVAHGRPPRAGDVVLVRWAHRPGQLSVKRAVRADGAGWHVEGDNPFASTDSRELGPAEVLGVVRFRVWPRPGRLKRSPWAGGGLELG
ncbi:S26 family signal peptidase [Actinosynnema pretiosum]|uniref:S26 family signal peptidase n=1 Tax=Actinosynnema pretiosum TaxID=42197 RepID=UPI0028109F65|nr:S26 family signal peptidase [Actinosynnema pretiosum]